MSSLHHDDKIDSTTGDQNKPEMITFYNSTKAGVDVVDELCGSYNVSRNSKRWPMTIYYWMLNIAAINANIIFRENLGKNTKRTEFIRNLGLALIYEHLKLRRDQKNIPTYIRQRISSQISEPRSSAQNIPGRYVRCGDCPNKKGRKTKHACASCGNVICMEHGTFFCKNCTDLNSSS